MFDVAVSLHVSFTLHEATFLEIRSIAIYCMIWNLHTTLNSKGNCATIEPFPTLDLPSHQVP
jgi:hypothetical protein